VAGPIVGDAYVVVRAITAGVEKEIANAFNNADKVGRDSGNRVGGEFQKGFARSAGRGKGFFTPKLLRESEDAARSFANVTRKLYFLQPAATAVAGAIGVVGTSLISLVSVIGAAAFPALVTLAGAFTALGQAALTVKLAFSGVAKAIQAGTKAQKGGNKEAKKQKDLTEKIRRATVDYAKLIRDNAESEEAGRKRVTDANRDYIETLREAREELQQLAFDSEDAAISEQKAALDLEKAREALARVADLPPNSRARKEAELAFAEADLNYRRAIDANNDLKEQEAKNAKLGPDLESQVKGQQKVVDAVNEQKDAVGDLKNLIVDNKEAQKRAAYDLKELKNSTDDASGAADAYKDALAELSPEARKFAEYMVDKFIPALKALRTAAGKNLFPKLEEALENLRTKLFPVLIPLLEKTGGVIGNVAKKISETITSTENLKRLKTVWETNDTFIANFGAAIDNLYEVFLILLTVASPLITEFGEWLKTLTGTWRETLNTKEGVEKLSERFEKAGDILKDLGTIFGNVFGGIGKIFDANTGPGSGGQRFLDYFKDASEKFKNIETIDGKPLKTFFDDAAKNGTAFLDLIGKILGNFIKLADNPELGIFFKQLEKVADIFGEIGEDLTGSLPAFGNFLISFSKLVQKFTESGSITTFFNTLTKILDALNWFFGSPVGKALINAASLVLPLAAAFGVVYKAVAFFSKVVIGNFARVIGSVGRLKGAIAGLGGKDPFARMRTGSGLTRVELQKQMIVDKQKKAALRGIYLSADQAGQKIQALGVKSGTATPLIGKSAVQSNIAAKAKYGLARAATAAGAGLTRAGRGLSALTGGPLGILLLLLPLIIQNWDKIVAFFKELPTKLKEIFTKVWDATTEALPKIWDKIKEVVGNVIGWLKDNWPLILAVLTGPFGLAILAIVKNWDTILDFIKGLPAKIAALASKIWDWIVDTFKTAVELYIAAWSAIFDFIKGLGGKLLEIGAKIWDWIVDVFKIAIELYIGAWVAIFDFIKELPGKLLALGKKIWDWIVDVFKIAIDLYIGAWKAIFDFIGGLGTKLKEIGLKIWDWIVDLVKERIENIKTNFGLVVEFIKGLPAKFLAAGTAIWGWVSEKLTSAIDKAKSLFTGFIDYIKGLPARIASAAGKLFDGVKDAFRSALNFIIGKWNSFSLSLTFPKSVFGIPLGPLAGKGFTLNTPDITPLAKGGIIPATSGGMLARIGEAGRPERVEPLDPDGLSKRDKAMIGLLSGNGMTVNVYPSPGMDERELAALVSRQIAYSLRKGAA
jgi:phage-related protein